MDKATFMLVFSQDFSEVRDVFSVGMQFCGPSEGPTGGGASFTLNQTVSVTMSHLQISVSSKYCLTKKYLYQILILKRV